MQSNSNKYFTRNPWLIIAILSAQVCNGQYDSVKRSNFVRLADGVLHNIGSPIRWDLNDWTKTGVILLSTIAISTTDQHVNSFWTGKDDPILNIVDDVGYYYGKSYSAFLFTGGFYLAGLVLKNEWAKETGIILGTALLTSAAMEATLKPLIGRARPENGSGNYDFRPFRKEGLSHAFPSGHATIAFTLTFVLAKRIDDIPIKIFLYSLAASTVLCRMYSNSHWLSDVAFGGTLAWFSASESNSHLTLNKFRKRRKTELSLKPTIGGMTLTISFN